MKEFSFQSLQVAKSPIYKTEYTIARNTRIQITFKPNANKTKKDTENSSLNG